MREVAAAWEKARKFVDQDHAAPRARDERAGARGESEPRRREGEGGEGSESGSGGSSASELGGSSDDDGDGSVAQDELATDPLPVGELYTDVDEVGTKRGASSRRAGKDGLPAGGDDGSSDEEENEAKEKQQQPFAWSWDTGAKQQPSAEGARKAKQLWDDDDGY